SPRGRADPTRRPLARPLQSHPVLDLPPKASGQARGDLLIATDDMIALVADAERSESRTPVCVDEQQEVQTALLIDLEAILDRVRHVDDSLDQIPRATRLKILP